MKNKVFVKLLTFLFIFYLLLIVSSCKKETSPTLTTSVSDFYTSRIVKLQANISDDGGNEVSSRGFVWSTNPEPSIANNANMVEVGQGLGSFEYTLNNLLPGTSYYIRAYGTNEIGTSYGNQVLVTTKGNLCGSNPTVTDIEGNIYNVIVIEDDCWMAENLKTTKYNDNTPITNIIENTVWKNSQNAAYCWYNNDESYKEIYGAMYNYHAVASDKLCPDGWHVPTDDEWKRLEGTIDGNYAVGDPIWDTQGWRGSDIGAKLKAGDDWLATGTGTDEYGFTALAGGERDGQSGEFQRLNEWGNWWAHKNADESDVFRRYLSSQNNNIARFNCNPASGYSVRCIKD